MNSEQIDEIAKKLSPSKLIAWIESRQFADGGSDWSYQILNSEDCLNINRDYLELRVQNWKLIYSNGVLLSASKFS